MLKAIAKTWRFCGLHFIQVSLRLLKRIESDMGGTVANSVDGNAHAQFSSRAHRLLHLLLRQHQYTVIVGITLKTIEHSCGLRAECSIRKDFDAAEVKHIITKPGSHAQFSKFRQHL